MEYIDIVNEMDEIINVANRDDIYTKKLPHRIVHILIKNKKGKLALQLRSNQVKFCPLHWSTSVGGHVQSGETCEQAALREFKEELGINLPITFLEKYYYCDKNDLKKFLYVYEMEFEGPFQINPKEVESVDYFSKLELKKMIRNGDKFHPELLFILQKLNYIKP